MANEIIAIGKLSMRTLKVNPAKHATEGKATPIARILGRATGIKEIVDKVRGDVYESIVGTFEGENLETGELFQSDTLYLPSGIHGLLEKAVKENTQHDNVVDFALEIRVVKASNPAGYSYEAVNIVPAKATDPLAELKRAIEAKTNSAALPPPISKK